MRCHQPPTTARTMLRPRDPVGELMVVMAFAAFALAAVIGVVAAFLALTSPV